MIYANVMSIKGDELQKIISKYPSGKIILQFKTDDGGNTYYVTGFAHNNTVNPPFTLISLTKSYPLPINLTKFYISTLIFRYKDPPFPIDPSKTYYLYPAYDTYLGLPDPNIIYVHVPKKLSDLISENGITEKDLNEDEFMKALEKLNNYLLRNGSAFNPIPPKLVP